MKPRINIITLSVDDLKKSLKFYRALGFKSEGIVGQEFEHGSVAFFDLENRLKLALYERKNLAWDAKVQQQARSATEFSIGHLVKSEKEVDAVMVRAKKAGARIPKKAGKTFWGGYAGYFQDPDGHLWEVAYNPAWTE